MSNGDHRLSKRRKCSPDIEEVRDENSWYDEGSLGYVCVCVCVSERVVIRKWMSHFTGCSSPLSPSLSLSGGQQWKWARPCSKCGDLVANPALFPALSPLNDAHCILPRRRRRRRRRRKEGGGRDGAETTPALPPSLLSSADMEGAAIRSKDLW